MAKLSKPRKLDLIWASEAIPANIAEPDATGKFTGSSGTYYAKEGWSQVKPPYEIENWVQNQQSQFSAYINQLGIPEWDSSTEYQANKSYVQGSNNTLYKCISTNSGRNPVAGNTGHWEVFEGNRQATTSARGNVELSTVAEAITGVSETLAVTPAGLKGAIDAIPKGDDNTSLLPIIFPVNSIVMRPTNPGNSIVSGGMGFGTWEKIEGRFLIGTGSTRDSRGYTESFSYGNTGGEFEHRLSTSEMPRHSHTVSLKRDRAAGTEGNAVYGDEAREGVGTERTSSAGSGAAHNNMPPYFSVDIWRRTS